jgi:hypothetical protein
MRNDKVNNLGGNFTGSLKKFLLLPVIAMSKNKIKIRQSAGN